MRLLITNQQFAKAGEPRVRNFDDPAPRAFALRPVAAFLAAGPHMRGVVPRDHVLPGHGADETGVGTQVLAGAGRHRGSRDHHRVERGHQLGDVISIGRGHDDRQRDATGVHQQHSLASIFFPGRWGWARPTLVPAAP